MCGIAGWISWDRDLRSQAATVHALGEPMSCRGPDAEGLWLFPHAGFAHRRLIVIDPEGGAQPMVRRRGTQSFAIAYNGEIYNTAEVKSQLEALGHVFGSRSDTEVVLRAYMEWGPTSVERLNGIFAYGIWDEAAQTLFLARDRLGVKPLFFAQKGADLIFASELKGIVAHPKFPAAVDREGLAELFAMGPSRTPGFGVFHGIEELLPGQYLVHSPKGTYRRTYWNLVSKPHEDDLDTTVGMLRELLRDIVERQLVSDVPIATLLSGGLDSSAVSALAQGVFHARHLGPIDTFSVDYVGMERDFQANPFQTSIDAPFARMMSEYLGTRHHQVLLDTPDLVTALMDSLIARDLPGMADVDTSLLLFSRAMKQTVTVALSGEAADEVFGGYPWFYRPEALAARTFPWNLRIRERASLLWPAVREEVQPEAYLAERYHEALSEVPRLPGEDPKEARMRELLYLNITRFLPTLLDRKDRMTMATGLEVRVPFCDHRLVEYVWNIPWALKTVGDTPKGILRRAVADVLPEAVAYRKKSPYPATHNPAYGEAMRRLFLEVIQKPNAPIRDFINPQAVEALVNEGNRLGGLPWFSQLMGIPQLYAYLVQTNAWFEYYHVSVR